MDDDLGEVFGVFQSFVDKRLAAIMTHVDAVAVPDVSSTDVFAGPHPKGVPVARVEGDAADGVRAITLEDGFPGSPRVDRFPEVS